VFENPRACIIRRHILHRRVVQLGPECDELSVGVIGSVNVIWRVSRISPNNVTALWRLFEPIYKTDGDLKGATLTHMLALPTQLRNNLARSFLEKNRSST
jgi:hypothetical protein